MVLFQAEGYMCAGSLFPIIRGENSPMKQHSIPLWTDENSEPKCLFWSILPIWSKLKCLAIHVHKALSHSLHRNIFPWKDFIQKNKVVLCKSENLAFTCSSQNWGRNRKSALLLETQNSCGQQKSNALCRNVVSWQASAHNHYHSVLFPSPCACSCTVLTPEHQWCCHGKGHETELCYQNQMWFSVMDCCVRLHLTKHHYLIKHVSAQVKNHSESKQNQIINTESEWHFPIF